MKIKQKISQLTSGFFAICSLALVVLPVSCTGKRKPGHETGINAQMLIVSHAKKFKIELRDGYSQVSVLDPWQGATNVVQSWFLLPRGKKPPAGIDTAEIIYVPVKNIVCLSTTHLAMISALDEAGSVTGFSGTKFIFDRELEEYVNNGSIREIGYEDNLNKELIAELNPDMVMVYGVGSESSGYTGKLKELGIKVFFNADYLEMDPLGKAEWIKLMGALYCKERLADSIFSSVEEKYTRLRSFISEKTGKRPDVLLGLPFRDTWYISPGNSYISKLIQDAGGNYLWKDKESPVAFPSSLEAVYLKALQAEYWLNIGTADSKTGICAVDPRLADLESFRLGNLFNNNKRISIGGGNDYWESGSINPQIVLADIAAILHPELFPDAELY
ncbi:MAG: ABC transporter substrate-binding protein, partial [Bacteroidales bacterium]